MVEPEKLQEVVTPPNETAIIIAREQLGNAIHTTPVWQWQGLRKRQCLGDDTEVWLKLELLQRSGCFKPRGAITVINHAIEQAKQHGIAAVSAGNHAIAVSYAANIKGLSAKVFLPKTANPYRVAKCREYGAEVILAETIQQAFTACEHECQQHQRLFIHPYEGPYTALGNATLGAELCRQVPGLDVVLVAVGGGGLIAGIGSAVKQMQPQCEVIGVEPVGANSLYASFQQGSPQAIPKINTIADSLGAPSAAPYSFALCQQVVDQLILVDDDALKHAMKIMFEDLKLAVEPACAAVLAAAIGPLAKELQGKRVALVLCGSNIDVATFTQLLQTQRGTP